MAVRQPFKWYGIAFLRITASIKRRQEFAADRFAGARAGRGPVRRACARCTPQARHSMSSGVARWCPSCRSGAARRSPTASVASRRATPSARRPRSSCVTSSRSARPTPTTRTRRSPSAWRRSNRFPRASPTSPRTRSSCSMIEAGVERRVLDFLLGPEAGEFRPRRLGRGRRGGLRRAPAEPAGVQGGPGGRDRGRPSGRGSATSRDGRPDPAPRTTRPRCRTWSRWSWPTACCSRCTAPAGRSPRHRPSRSWRACARRTSSRRTVGGAAGGRAPAAWRARGRWHRRFDAGRSRESAERVTVKARGPRSTPGALRTTMLDLIAVTNWSKRPGGLAPASAAAGHRCGFR